MDALKRLTYKDLENEMSRRRLVFFIQKTKPEYRAQWFHHYICERVEEWARGEGKKRLMIFVPPQHGKSQISTRHTPAWLLGINPDEKVGIAAYNGTVASGFNRDVQRIMESSEYRAIFPDTELPAKRDSRGYVRNNYEFDIVGRAGSLVSVGVGGGLTSRQIDTMIIDDVYKDAQEAWSPLQRANVQEWYDTVVQTRLHNESKMLIVFTRWHEEDLGGWLLKENPEEWDVVKIPALRESLQDNLGENDPRKIGEALWEERHSRERLLAIKARSLITFENLYQQDPQPAKGLLYGEFKTYTKEDFKRASTDVVYTTGCYVDIADRGEDNLCAIAYAQIGELVYILDVLYTNKSADETEGMLAKMLLDNNVNNVLIEANAGGRIFAKLVERHYVGKLRGRSCAFSTFTQTANKEARIISAAGLVNELIAMPVDWHIRFPEFYSEISRFDKVFKKNKNDDGADALTGVVENIERKVGEYYYGSL